MIKIIATLLILSLHLTVFSQTIARLEPQNWWTGMQWNTVTVLVYGQNIGQLMPSVDYKGVRVVKMTKVENPNYLFITLNIAPQTRAGNMKIVFKKAGKSFITKDFPLLEREKGSAFRQGFTHRDAILLIVPDRFSNGDPGNDYVAGMKEQTMDRAGEGNRHGGDIQGIIDHLDYIKSLGFTQIWNTPLIENNQPEYSYHGYAATDFYTIDPRFGTNEQFKTFVRAAKERGIGVIWDVVLNHCGAEYYFIKDLPSKDWVHFHDTKTRTNHLKTTLTDPYATEIDKKEYTDGWFDLSMADLNQSNPLMAQYLIQNTIWWIEYAGLSGFREDTYSYSDKDFLTQWTKAILHEYPNFNIVGEEMTTKPDIAAYWQKDKINKDGYKGTLPTLMDFPLNENLVKSLNISNSWFSSWRDTYQSIAQDYLFPHPDNQLIFPDNHDLDRFYSRVNKNLDHWKLGIALYVTMRGIPQFLYGTELLMTNEKPGNDGQRRGDFYGGWQGDAKNAKTKAGLTEQELAAQTFFSNLLNWRKNKQVIHTGKLKHYAPQKDDVYIYFRYNDREKVMVLLNKNEAAVTVDMNRYKEIIPNHFTAKDIVSNTAITVNNTLEIAAKTAMILEINQ